MSRDNIICRNCGFANPGVAGFCGRCGQKLRTEPVQRIADAIYCPYCEVANPPDAVYCGGCGRQISTADFGLSPHPAAPAPAAATAPSDESTSPSRRLMAVIIGAGLVFFLAIGALFLLPQLLSPAPRGAGDETNELTGAIATAELESTDTAPPTDEPTAEKDAIVPSPPLPTPTITLTPTPWPTVTPEPTLPVVTVVAPLAGSGFTQLTFGPERDYTPSLSPDQRRLVISSEIGGEWQLVEIDVNGGNRFSVMTTGLSNVQSPHFSPDGRSLLVTAERNGQQDIYQLDSESGAVIAQLTELPGDEYFPRWLADGSGFIFSWQHNDIEAIFYYTLDGVQDELVDAASFVGFAWPSPDGRQVAYYSGEDGDYEIYVMDIDGRNQRRLTNNSGRDASPTWSPDGEWIAFESARNGNYDLFIMRPDGSDVRQLTSGPDNDFFPSFSADGQWLLFQSDRTGNMDVYRMPFAP